VVFSEKYIRKDGEESEKRQKVKKETPCIKKKEQKNKHA